MANIGIGAPRKIRKGNLMESTQTIQPISMINRMNKNKVIDKPTKRVGTIVQGMVKTKLEIVGVEKASLFPHRCSLNFSLTVECPRMT